MEVVSAQIKDQMASASWIRKMFRLDKEKGTHKEGEEAPSEFIIQKTADFAIASCCNPIPGDPVIGFKAPDGTVTVHKKTCPVAESIAAMHGDWVVVPKWQDQAEDNSFLVRISLRGLDRMGMLNEISRYISQVMGVNMRRLSMSADQGVFEGYIDMYVASREILDRIIRDMSAIKGVENVSRSEL